jgi:protein TIF31
MPRSNNGAELSKSKTYNLSLEDELSHLRSKSSISEISPAPVNLTGLASKSISYKEVAAAPPGTVLKPLLENVKETDEKPGTQECSDLSETSKLGENTDEKGAHDRSEKSSSETEDISCSSKLEKSPTENNGSRLSAAAEPFNPSQLNSTVVATSVYDLRATQAMLTEPAVMTRASRGPRSPLCYRANHSHSFLKDHQHPISEKGEPRIMNPHAPEYFPRRTWRTNVNSNVTTEVESNNNVHEESPLNKESSKKSTSETEKSELARQILLSFIVKSVQNNKEDPPPTSEPSWKNADPENPSDAIANDSAIIKILYGNEGKDVKELDLNKTEESDGEGFTVVTKRKRNKQNFTNGVTGLYNQQQSICASVR